MKEYLIDENYNEVRVGDEVQNDHVRFFIGAINESGLCAIDKTKDFKLLDELHPMAVCIKQGNYSVHCGGMVRLNT